MPDTYSISQNNNGATPKNKATAAAQQLIQEVMRNVFPEIFAFSGDVNLNITVHIHCCDLDEFPVE